MEVISAHGDGQSWAAWVIYIVNGAKSTVDNPPPGQRDGASSVVWMEFQVVGNNPLQSSRIDPDLAAAASQMFGERTVGQLADGAVASDGFPILGA